mmetsp:Transcript_842/g.2500  ORF Transcript_842/g.2500 Transcript_842/m.2500 type:complete len:347 (+) Transcript_842:851-1891(+)
MWPPRNLDTMNLSTTAYSAAMLATRMLRNPSPTPKLSIRVHIVFRIMDPHTRVARRSSLVVPARRKGPSRWVVTSPWTAAAAAKMYSPRFLMKASPVPPSLVFCFSAGRVDTRTCTTMEEKIMAPNPSWNTFPGVCSRSPNGSLSAPRGPASSTCARNLLSSPGRGRRKQSRDRRTAATVMAARRGRSWSSSHRYRRSSGEYLSPLEEEDEVVARRGVARSTTTTTTSVRRRWRWRWWSSSSSPAASPRRRRRRRWRGALPNPGTPLLRANDADVDADVDGAASLSPAAAACLIPLRSIRSLSLSLSRVLWTSWRWRRKEAGQARRDVRVREKRIGSSFRSVVKTD